MDWTSKRAVVTGRWWPASEAISANSWYGQAPPSQRSSATTHVATTGVSVTPTAIHFAGRIPDDAVRAYYTPALAVIVPSTGYETFGFVLIEAFQHGTPVIARRIGPFPEIVERCNGGELFVTREELIAAVRRLATDQSYRERLGRSARAGYQEYWTEEKVLPRYLAVVRGAASPERESPCRAGPRNVAEVH